MSELDKQIRTMELAAYLNDIRKGHARGEVEADGLQDISLYREDALSVLFYYLQKSPVDLRHPKQLTGITSGFMSISPPVDLALAASSGDLTT
jgi:hypothetical protein